MRRNKFWKKSVLLTVILLIAIIGVGVTVALSVAQTNKVTNTFKAGKIDTSIDEVVKPDLTKEVSVSNSNEAQSDAYVRVRITAPADVKLEFNSGDSGWSEEQLDGYYYYLYSVEPNGKTENLLTNVIPASEVENFDVTVYHEACIATTEHRNTEGNLPLNVEAVQEAFTKATTSGSGN